MAKSAKGSQFGTIALIVVFIIFLGVAAYLIYRRVKSRVPVTPPSPSSCPTYSSFTGNLTGPGLQMTNVSIPAAITQSACQTICDTNDCDWYTYSADNGGTCTVNKAQAAVSPSINTGFRVNPVTPNCPTYSLLPQEQTGAGFDRGSQSQTSEPDCQTACTANPDQCQWYGYESDTQKCWFNATPTGGTTTTAFRMR